MCAHLENPVPFRLLLDQLAKLYQRWLDFSMGLRSNGDAERVMQGWVQEMWGYSIAAASVGIKHTVLREFQRTVRFLRNGEMTYYDNVKLLETVGQHLSLQFPAEQQNDVHEFLTKLLEQLEMELADTVHKDLVKEHFGATTAELKVRQHDGKLNNKKTETTTTYLLSVKVEGIGSLEEGIRLLRAGQVRKHEVVEPLADLVKDGHLDIADLEAIVAARLSGISRARLHRSALCWAGGHW